MNTTSQTLRTMHPRVSKVLRPRFVKLRIGGLYKTARPPAAADYFCVVGAYLIQGYWNKIYAPDTFLVLSYAGHRSDTDDILMPECDHYQILHGDKIGRLDIREGDEDLWEECEWNAP